MPPKQASHDANLQEQLATMMMCLEAMQLEINILQLQSIAGSPGPSVVKSLQLEPTVSKPELFSGAEHEDLAIFLQQCELSFELQASRFPTDYYKVGFILSYLQGPATYWAGLYLLNKIHKLQNDLAEFTVIEEAFKDSTH